MRPVRAISSAPAENGHMITGLERDVFFPPDSVQHTGTIAFELPIGGFAGLVLHIDVEITMWIRPLHLRDHSAQRDGLAPIIFRTEGVMREQRSCRQPESDS